VLNYSTRAFVCRSHAEDQHTRLRGVRDNDKRLPGLLRVLFDTVGRRHAAGEQEAAHHIDRPVLQYDRIGRGKPARARPHTTLARIISSLGALEIDLPPSSGD